MIDKACGDVCRMRCVSYDPEPYINLNADPYRGYYKEPVAVYTPIDCGTDGELDKVAKMLRSYPKSRHRYYRGLSNMV